jgi:hypothetical protein
VVLLELDVSVGNNTQELGSQLAVLCKFCMLAHISFLVGLGKGNVICKVDS